MTGHLEKAGSCYGFGGYKNVKSFDRTWLFQKSREKYKFFLVNSVTTQPEGSIKNIIREH